MTDELLDAYLSDHQDALAETALDLVGIDTQNPPGDTRRAVEYVTTWFEDLDIETEEVTADPAKPNLLATLPGDRETTLLYLGHLDTVPYETEAWTRDPLGERDGERLYGRGTTDMKGAVAAMLWTAQAFVETGQTPPADLRFAFVSDEETGGDAGLPSLLERDALAADACVIGETTCEGGRHSVTVADRGSIWLTLEAIGKPAHGSRPVLGENAIDRLYDAVETLREEFGARPLEIAPAVEPVIEESIAYYTPIMGEETAHDLFAYPTINLGTIEGGQAINTVPTTARAEIDIRLSPGVHTPTIIEEIRTCARSCDGVSITDLAWSIGTYEETDSTFVEAVATVAEDVLGTDIYRRSATGGGDAKKLRNAEISTVEFAVGTDTAHAPDEYTTIDALHTNARVYAALPSALEGL